MTIQTINSIEATWKSVKTNLRNESLPQVFTLQDGSRITYYPASSLSNEAGHKNMNAREYNLLSPSGCLVTVTNIAAFCKDVFGVNPSGSPKYASSFSEMFSGVRKEDNVMGWKVYQTEETVSKVA